MNQKHDRRWMFFGLFVLVGLAALVPFVFQAVKDFRIMQVYEEAECQIVNRRMVPSTTVYRWSGGRETESTVLLPEFTFVFRARGQEWMATGFDNLDGKLAEAADYAGLDVGMKTRCWYDPVRPEHAVLLRRVPWRFYLGSLIPLTFLVVGGSLMKRMLSRKVDAGSGAVGVGRVLRFRLAPVLSHQRLTGCLFGLMLVTGLAMMVACAVPWGSSSTELLGPGVWVVGGLGLVLAFLAKHFWRAARLMRVPEPEVEISAEPMLPGERAAVRVTQGGVLRAESFQVLLVCEEVASRTRTPVKTVLLDAGEMVIDDDRETSVRAFDLEMTVPAKAKPSARAVQSMRTWSIRVRRRMQGGTTLETDFPFRVLKSGEAFL